MSCSLSLWRGSRTAGRAAACRVVPGRGEDRERPPGDPATARMQSRQPPTRLPPQESDISRFENPVSTQPHHFHLPLLQTRLSSYYPPALNSLEWSPTCDGGLKPVGLLAAVIGYSR